jgi:hypothetical protein
LINLPRGTAAAEEVLYLRNGVEGQAPA